MAQMPCDGDGICMLCTFKPSAEEQLTCKTCITPWHVACLAAPPPTLASTLNWECPDCVAPADDAPVAKPVSAAPGSEKSGELLAAIRAIEADASLTDREKAKRRQKLLSGSASGSDGDKEGPDPNEKRDGDCDSMNDVLNLFNGSFNCAFCMQLLERPVTTPCGHNFCLKCFTKWVGQGKNTCAKCRTTIPCKMSSQPRINSTLVAAIRMARMSKSIVKGGPAKVYHFLHNQNRPDTAFTTERAKKAGKANAASGKIFVTIPRDYFGPITAENDPVRNQGVLVGESWADRMECRQWGAHFPHVSGIGGQSKHGAQSVALSGGYEDDEDHGEWFLYTGSGGRDLSGNKRTNKDQSFDQTFDLSNEALRLSCRKGYPVRVVRSHKEKRSSYAPDCGVRYDGIYRIEKCWRKNGKQGFKVCRYLFVRCDNDPAPWTSDERGDFPRPLPSVPELKHAIDITERKQSPSWDYDEAEACWKWKVAPPPSLLPVETQDPEDRVRVRAVIRRTQTMTVRQRLLKEFSCLMCSKVMTLPLTTPCAHNFCKPCLEGAFAGQAFVNERSRGGRTLRARKNVMKCPSCPVDISDFLQNPQVNRELMDVIESLQRETEAIEEEKAAEHDKGIEDLNELEKVDENKLEKEGPNKLGKEEENKLEKGEANELEKLKANEPEKEGEHAHEKKDTEEENEDEEQQDADSCESAISEEAEGLKESNHFASGCSSKDGIEKEIGVSMGRKSGVEDKPVANSEDRGENSDMPNPPVQDKPQKSCKRQKVDTGDALKSFNANEQNACTDKAEKVCAGKPQGNKKQSKRKSEMVEMKENVGMRITRSKKS